MANPFCHVELATDDPAKAKEFYGQLFDWTLEDLPMGDLTYTMVKVGDGTGGGIMKNPMPGTPSHWLSYVLVADITTSTEKAQSLGGTVLKEKMEVAGFGWLSIIQDPTGAVLGLWQPASE